jgi:hypothetical protein
LLEAADRLGDFIKFLRVSAVDCRPAFTAGDAESQRSPVLVLKVARSVAGQIAEALEAAHEKGVVRCDSIGELLICATTRRIGRAFLGGEGDIKWGFDSGNLKPPAMARSP